MKRRGLGVPGPGKEAMRNQHAGIRAAFVLAACLAGDTRPLASQQPDPLPRPAQVLLDAAPRVAALPFTIPPTVRERTVPPSALTLEQLEQLAAAHNPTLAQAARRVEAVEGEQVQVGLYPNPTVGYMSEEVGEEGQAGQHGVYVRQELVTANKLGWNRAVASQEVLQARWELQVQQWRVTNAVRIQAYEVLAAQRTVEVTEELFAIGKAAVDAAERLFQARQVSQVDVLQARVEANSAQLHLIAARKTRDAAWRRLAIVIGMPDMKPAPLENRLDDELPEIAWSDTVQHLQAESPQIAAARTGVARAQRRRAGLRRTHAKHRNRSGRPPQRPLGRHHVEPADWDTLDDLRPQSREYHAGAGRTPGGSTESGACGTAASRPLGRSVSRVRDRAGTGDPIPASHSSRWRKSLELTRAGYQQNEFGYLELLTAQQTFTRTNLAYIAALRELWLSITKIDGMLLTGGLDAPQS